MYVIGNDPDTDKTGNPVMKRNHHEKFERKQLRRWQRLTGKRSYLNSTNGG
jgi:hypothetical protein